MARRLRSPTLESRSSRLKLRVRRRPYFVSVAPSIGLGYRRNLGAGSWLVRCADGKGSAWTRGFAVADDFEDANGNDVIDFWSAADRARELVRGKAADADKPITVDEALADFARDLTARDGLPANVSRVRYHLTPALAGMPVSTLTPAALRRWRDGLLAKGLKPATVVRTAKALAAALAQTGVGDPAVWRKGLGGLRDTHTARNIILSTAQGRSLVAAAYAEDQALGLLAETAAQTGARPVQLARLEIADLQDARPAPRLMMPSSRKGKGRKRIERKAVPIAPELAAKLRQAAGNRPAAAPLLVKSNGEPWRPSNHSLPFARAVIAAGLDRKVTIYALRHSHIAHQILAGVPLRIIAATCDTSTAMLEATYSAFIHDIADDVTRGALRDFSPPEDTAATVVPLAARRS